MIINVIKKFIKVKLYIGVFVLDYLEDDFWFGFVILSEK